MPKVHDRWTVLPHGPVETIDDGLLTVAGEIPMPLGNFPRRMTVVRLASGGTAIFSAIALDEAGMARVEALGDPTFLIVPNDHHRLDARIWKARYPGLRVLTAPAGRQRVEEVVAVDATEDVIGDKSIALRIVPGCAEAEIALEVRRGPRLTLITNDILGNVAHPHGIGAKIMARLTGFGVARPRIPYVARGSIKDKPALAAQLRAWADDADLVRIVPSHGDVVADDPAGALRRAAADIDR